MFESFHCGDWGWCVPSEFSQDILHPHGGGDLTKDPIGAAEHLYPSITYHPFVSPPNADWARKNGVEAGAVPTAPYFYSDILPIP